MQKLNTKLHKDSPVIDDSIVNWSHVYGALFLLAVGIVLISIIYNWETGKQVRAPVSPTPIHNVCIQVITPAQNQTTGEIKDFPTPCDVPEGWVIQN